MNWFSRKSSVGRQLVECRANTDAVLQVLTAVASATTADTAAKLALDTVRTAFGWAYGSYWIVDRQEPVLKFAVESGAVNEEFRRVTASASFREGIGLSGRVWKSRELFFTPDLSQMTDCCRAPVAQRAGVKSGVCFPILIEGQVVGTMDFFALEALSLSSERFATLRSIGNLVSGAIARIRKSELQAQAADDAATVNRVLEAVAKAANVDQAAKLALDTVRSAFGWAYGSYWTVDPQERILKFSVESGAVNEEFRRVTASASFREGIGLSGRVWKSRELFFTPDLSQMTDCCRAPVAQRAGVKSGVCFPILIEGQVVGTMDFFALERLDPPKERLEALRSVGRLVSAAIARIEAMQGMQKILHQVALNVVNFKSSAGTLNCVSQQLGANAEETAVQSSVVAAASEEVSQNVQSIVAAVEEMSTTIRGITRNASDATEVGANAMTEAESAKATIAKLGESSAEIGKVIKVITAIAEQTNLLALNATIEAARAGEAGKGFAVVANEVKELAKETAKATEEIGQKITAIQSDTKEAVQAIQRFGATMKKISDLQSGIATAVEEQSVTTNEIARNIGEAAKGASEIASNIGSVAQAAQSTTQGASQTQKTSADIAQMASELQRMVTEFQASQESAVDPTRSPKRNGRPSGDSYSKGNRQLSER